MNDIYNTKLLNLLPPNLQNDPDMMAAANSVDKEFLDVVNSAKECILLPNIDNLPSNVVDVLAWQQHVDFYDVALDLDKKRELVKNSIRWHRKKGTPAAVEEVVSTFFKNSKVQEWFEYDGKPYFFKVVFNYNLDDEVETNLIQKKWSSKYFYLDGSWNLDGQNNLNGCEVYSEDTSTGNYIETSVVSAINSVKNKRSWLDEFLLILRGVTSEKEVYTVKVANKFFLDFFKNVDLHLDGSWEINGQYDLNGYKVYFHDPIVVKEVNHIFIQKYEQLDANFMLKAAPILNNENFDSKEANRIFNKITQSITLSEFNSASIIKNEQLNIGYNLKVPAAIEKENFSERSINKISNKVNNSIGSSIKSSSLVQNKELFACNDLIIKKGLWYLDGSSALDGSNLLDADIFQEAI